MARRILLCLSPSGATVAQWKGNLVEVSAFGADDDGLAAFGAWVAKSTGIPALVVVDIPEEDYRFETMPHTTGRDRQDLLARKLKQFYRGTPFYAASVVSQSTSKTGGRREDVAMFCALTGAEAITPWLRILRERGLPLVAVHALPTVTPAVARLLKLDTRNLLLISRQQAGLRQTFLKDGGFRLSRLTPLHASEDRGLETVFASEVRNTRLYLDSQGITTADDVITVAILDQDDSLVLLPERILNLGGNLLCQHLPRSALVKQLGIPATVLDTSRDALHLHLLGGKVSAPNLAMADMVSDYRLYRLRHLLFVASGVVATAGGLWFGTQLYRAVDLDDQTVEAATQTERFHRLYEQLTRDFPAAPAGAVVMQKTGDFAQRLRATAPSPEPLLLALSQALEKAPSISVQTINWSYGKSAYQSGALGSPVTPGAGGDTPGATGMVLGEISPFDGNYRAAVDTIRLFTEQLRASPAVADVRVVKYPLDDSSQQVLSGSTSARAERKASSVFEVLVRMREGGGGR